MTIFTDAVNLSTPYTNTLCDFVRVTFAEWTTTARFAGVRLLHCDRHTVSEALHFRLGKNARFAIGFRANGTSKAISRAS